MLSILIQQAFVFLFLTHKAIPVNISNTGEIYVPLATAIQIILLFVSEEGVMWHIKHCSFDSSGKHCLGNHCHLDAEFLGPRAEHVFSGIIVIKKEGSRKALTLNLCLKGTNHTGSSRRKLKLQNWIRTSGGICSILDEEKILVAKPFSNFGEMRVQCHCLNFSYMFLTAIFAPPFSWGWTG